MLDHKAEVEDSVSPHTSDAGYIGVCHVCVFLPEVDEEKRRKLMLEGVPEPCCQSFIWEQSVRDNVTDNKISEQVAYSLATSSVVHLPLVTVFVLSYVLSSPFPKAQMWLLLVTLSVTACRS